MGKAGLVGQKVAATLASTGTPAQFMHPAEAFHGDLGRVAADDLVLAFSNSGETEEVIRLLPSLRDLGATVVAITASADCTLGRYSKVVIELGKIPEACSMGLAPSSSTAAMLAAGDALALVVSRSKGFGPSDFARYHPGGSLGRKLARVEDVMRPIDQCRIAVDSLLLRQVLETQNHRGRRTGATMLVDGDGQLTGLFTDSDLVRRIAAGDMLPLDEPVSAMMTASPKSVPQGCRLTVALEILTAHKISELPVLDDAGRPLGLIDLTDVMELLPASSGTAARDEPAAGERRDEVTVPRIYQEPN